MTLRTRAPDRLASLISALKSFRASSNVGKPDSTLKARTKPKTAAGTGLIHLAFGRPFRPSPNDFLDGRIVDRFGVMAKRLVENTAFTVCNRERERLGFVAPI